jgi:hypothetical protein
MSAHDTSYTRRRNFENGRLGDASRFTRAYFLCRTSGPLLTGAVASGVSLYMPNLLNRDAYFYGLTLIRVGVVSWPCPQSAGF